MQKPINRPFMVLTRLMPSLGKETAGRVERQSTAPLAKVLQGAALERVPKFDRNGIRILTPFNSHSRRLK